MQMGDTEIVQENDITKLKEILRELEDTKLEYQNQVDSLQDEVQQLEDIAEMQISELILGAHYDENNDLEKFIKSPCTDEEELIAEISELDKKLKVSQELSNVIIDRTKFTVSKLDFDENIVARKHTIAGHTGDMPFLMECHVMEPLGNAEEGKPEISEFQMSVIPELYENIGESFQKFVSEKNVSGTFQLIGGFSRWMKLRQDTFEFFTTKYPDIVRVPQEATGKYLIIEKPQLQYIITWEINGESILADKPDLKLGIKVLEKGTDKDELNELRNAPEMFDKMLKSLGIERAIKTLVKLCSS